MSNLVEQNNAILEEVEECCNQKKVNADIIQVENVDESQIKSSIEINFENAKGEKDIKNA